MTVLSQIIASKAKLQVLRTLYYSKNFMPLRHIAYISDLPVFSVQYSVLDLQKQRVILKKKHKNFSLFKLNTEHPYFSLLAELFKADTALRLQAHAKTYKKQVAPTIKFIHSAQNIFKKVKSK